MENSRRIRQVPGAPNRTAGGNVYKSSNFHARCCLHSCTVSLSLSLMSDIDLTGELGQRAQERLSTEQLAWLTTVRPNGTPEPNPVWFLWDGSSIILRSQDNLKVRNIKANPNVVLNFESGEGGGDILVFHGVAEIAADAVFEQVRDAYVTKYAEGIKRLGTTPEKMFASYSLTISIKPTKLRGF